MIQLATLLLTLAPLPPQDGELRQALEEALARVEQGPIENLWAGAMDLRAPGTFSPAELDRSLERMLGRGEAGPRANLFLAAVYAAGDEPDALVLSQALLPLLEAEDAAVATAAAELLGDRRFKNGLTKERFGEQLTALLEGASDPDKSPELRLACAVSAHQTGGGLERRDARRELLAFMESSDPHLRRLAALALAEIGEEIYGALEDELRAIAQLPGTEGQLADAFLKQEEIKRLRDRKYKNLERIYRDNRLTGELAQIEGVLQMIENEHLDGDKFSREELIESAIDGMLRSLDEHSSYLSPKIYSRFFEELEAEYGGIGAYVQNDPADGLFTITRPIYSGPAYRAGLQSDDKIVRINDWSTIGKPTDEVIKRLKGKPDTDLRLYVWRRGMDPNLIDRPTEDMVVEVTRKQIEIPALSSQMLPGGVGLIELIDFSRVASAELRDAILELKGQGMRALVFDLRRNSGGLLDEARNVADLFLEKNQKVVSTAGRGRNGESYRAYRDPVLPSDFPMAVLVGRFSASASEIVSGALQDHERATIVGQRSFGKGSIQVLVPLEGSADDQFVDQNDNGRFDPWETITHDWDGDGEFDYAPRIKLTVGRYLLPSGRSIHRELDREKNIVEPGGVHPDLEVQSDRRQTWRLEEMWRIRNENHPRNYVDRYWDQHEDLFRELAVCDYKNTDLYPNFDAFLLEVNTVVPKDDVRLLVRNEIRRRVQDAQGAEFPYGDFQEDRQVQAAVKSVLEELGETYESIEDYRLTFDLDPLDSSTAPGLASVLPDSGELERTRQHLEEARRGDGTLSRETLDRLIELLGEEN